MLTFDVLTELTRRAAGETVGLSWQPASGCRKPFRYDQTFEGLVDVLPLEKMLSGTALCSACEGIVEWVYVLPTEPRAPVVVTNSRAVPVEVGGVMVPSRSVSLSPGPQGDYAVLEWTAPQSGVATIDVQFTGLSSSDTDVHVLAPGQLPWSSKVSPGHTEPKVMSVSVSACDRILLAVGYGEDWTHVGDTTQVQAQVRLQTIP